MASNYDFRVIINTISGSNISYGTSSLVSVQPGTSLVVNTNEMVDKINTMKNITVFNGKTHITASSLFNVSQSGRTFINTNIDGGGTDYQFLSASIKGHSDSGSILFHANATPSANGDFIKRYKFFGNKVCNVLGVPENYWIYSDKFRLTNTGSEQNYISGDVLAHSLHLKDNFAISNAGAIESDLPMRHAKDTDRWIKWTDVSSSIPQNDMLIGYGNQSNEYMIRMQNNKNLIISSSTVNANSNFLIKGNVGIGTDNPGHKLEVVGDISASGNLSASGLSLVNKNTGNPVFATLDTRGGTFQSTGDGFVNPFFNFIAPAALGAFSIPGFNFMTEDTEANLASPQISIRAVLANAVGVSGYPTAAGGGKEPTLMINSGSVDKGNGFYFNFANDGVGRLGIGALNPTTQLEVEGDITVGESIFHSGDDNTKIVFTEDVITFTAGNEQLLKLSEGSGQDQVIVGDGGDVDFIVKTGPDDSALVVHGASGSVGIGASTSEQVAKLDVIGTSNSTLSSGFAYGTALFRAPTSTTSGSISLQSGQGNVFTIGVNENEQTLGIGALGVPNQLNDSDYHLRIPKLGGAEVTGDISASGQYYGYQAQHYQFASRGGLMSTQTEEFMPFDIMHAFGGGTGAIDASGYDVARVFIAPFDGFVKKALVLTEETPRNTTMRIYKAGAGTTTPDMDNSSNRMVDAGVTVDIDTDDTSFLFSFDSAPGGDYEFSAGDRLALSLENASSNVYGDVMISLVLMYNVT